MQRFLNVTQIIAPNFLPFLLQMRALPLLSHRSIFSFLSPCYYGLQRRSRRFILQNLMQIINFNDTCAFHQSIVDSILEYSNSMIFSSPLKVIQLANSIYFSRFTSSFSCYFLKKIVPQSYKYKIHNNAWHASNGTTSQTTSSMKYPEKISIRIHCLMAKQILLLRNQLKE